MSEATRTSVPVGRWHVHFDAEPAVIAHVCDLHRALALQIDCADQHGNGDCDHVQHHACTCSAYVPCAPCQ